MLQDPPAADDRTIPANLHRKVYCIALPIDIQESDLSVLGLDSRQKEVPQKLGIRGGHSQNRRENPRFVLPLVVLGIEAVVA